MVSLNAFKKYVRRADNSEDDLLQRQLDAAVIQVKAMMGQDQSDDLPDSPPIDEAVYLKANSLYESRSFTKEGLEKSVNMKILSLLDSYQDTTSIPDNDNSRNVSAFIPEATA